MEFARLKTKQKIHFIGIGGVSMSALAITLAKEGFSVQGSDVLESSVTKQVEEYDIPVFIGHREGNIGGDVDLIVKTSTVRQNNPEIVRAKELGVEIINRFEILSCLVNRHKVRIGVVASHGKTTTSTLCWKAFWESKTETSAFIGAVVNELNSSIYQSATRDFCVVETDESDGSFAQMEFEQGIIGNIDNDHLEFYGGSEDELYRHFEVFAHKIQARDGFLVIGTDYPKSKRLFEQNPHPKTFSFSISTEEDFYTKNHILTSTFSQFDLYFKGRCIGQGVKIPMIGLHNINNAGLGLSLLYLNKGVPDSGCFENFAGIEKRMNKIGQIGNISVIDDYAHHPAKIKALIHSVEQNKPWDEVIYVFEPHKYSRISYLYNDFLHSFHDIKSPSSQLVVMEIFGVAGGLDFVITNDSFFADIQKVNKDVKLTHSGKNEELNNILLEKINWINSSKSLGIVFFGAGLSSFYAKNLKIYLEKLKNLT